MGFEAFTGERIADPHKSNEYIRGKIEPQGRDCALEWIPFGEFLEVGEYDRGRPGGYEKVLTVGKSSGSLEESNDWEAIPLGQSQILSG